MKRNCNTPLAEPRLGSGGGLLSQAYGIEELEELLDVCDLESIMHAIAHTYQSEDTPAVLTRNVGSDEGANARRIHIRDLTEIDDQGARGVGSHGRLEGKHRGQNERSVEAKNALSWLTSGLIVDLKGLLRHGGDSTSGTILNC
jgi:hypothetical protein